MMTPQNFRAAWGEENLFLFSVDDLSAIDIPVSSKLFLTEGGMPRQAPLFTDLHGLHLLPPEAPEKVLPGGDEFRLLEKHTIYWLLAIRWYRCLIALTQTGQIVTYSDESLQLGLVWLMNSSVSQFAETLLACRTSRERFWKRWPADYAKLLEISKTPEYENYEADSLSERIWLDSEIRRIDPVASSHPTSYWSGVLKDLDS